MTAGRERRERVHADRGPVVGGGDDPLDHLLPRAVQRLPQGRRQRPRGPRQGRREHHEGQDELRGLTNVNAQGHEEAGAPHADALAQPGLGSRGPARRQPVAVPAAAGAGMVYFHCFTWVVQAVRFF